jgi:ABC-type lipoprotein export system ATPase subunit
VKLSVHGLQFRYDHGEELFGALTHTFAPGSVTAITGPSGQGKSTLLYIVGLLLRPRRGRVCYDGRDLAGCTDAQASAVRAATIGFVFQDAALDQFRTILDAVVEPALYAGRRRVDAIPTARRLLDTLGVDHRADHRPGQISGGQAQRVAVCRALINDPAVLLADEPTGNLDRLSAQAVLDALSAATRAGRTVVIATHDPFVLEYADVVLGLPAGQDRT